MYIGEVGENHWMKVCAYDGTSFPLTSEHSRYLVQPNGTKKRNTRAQKRWLSESRKTESRKRSYHELQTSDMKFDAHSAFIAPIHRKRLRAVYMRNCTVITPERKKQKRGGGGGGAFNPICQPTQVAEWSRGYPWGV